MDTQRAYAPPDPPGERPSAPPSLAMVALAAAFALRPVLLVGLYTSGTERAALSNVALAAALALAVTCIWASPRRLGARMSATTWQGRAVPSVLLAEAVLIAFGASRDLVLVGLTLSTLLGMGYASAVEAERKRRREYESPRRS